mgnify:FL=1
MNLILHQKGTGEIQRGNTLSSPKFIDEFGELKKFDFIVMNPPFSDKDWSDGIKTTEDEYKRFDGYGIPPEKNGDYAWFLHVLKSLDSNGKAGFVMPHGGLFRGNSEETIRQQILKKRYIKAIISLPANLFYGTGIPACIIILDKENTDTREDIFLIDASRGFKKDGNKNRLREQDIEKIVQTYTNRVEIKGYSKIVKYTDVLDENTNNGNLNVPRYIQKIDETLPQNIAAHLKGGIPETDIESLEKLWNIAPELKNIIFKCIDEVHKVYHLALASSEIESAIGEDINILAEKDNEIIKLFSAWKNSVKNILLGITQTTIPKDLIREISMSLLQKYEEAKLLDNYDVYDCLLNYWNAKLQDDVYTIKVAGYDVARELEYEYGQKKKKDENGKIVKDENGDAVMEDDTTKVKSFEGALIPKEIIESEFFADKLSHLNSLIEQSATIEGELDEMIEEESGEEGLLKEVLNDKGDGIPKANLNKRLKELDDKKSSPIVDALTSLVSLFADGNTAKMEKIISEMPELEIYELRNKNGKFGKAKLQSAVKVASQEAKVPELFIDEYNALIKYHTKLAEKEAIDKEIKTARAKLDDLIVAKYAVLTDEEIKYLLFEKKWMAKLNQDVSDEVEQVLNNQEYY